MNFISLPSLIESIWKGVFIVIFPWDFNFSNSFKVCGAPLNSFLLCINVTFEYFENSKAQSKAVSPPPNIEIFFIFK